MFQTTIDACGDYSLFCQGKLADPYPLYRQLREEDPVHWSVPLGSWILTRYSDVLPALKEPRLISSRMPLYLKYLPDDLRARMGPLTRHLEKWLVNSDPPDHTRLRALVSKAFTPAVVEKLRHHIQEIVDGLLDPLEGSGHMDIIRDFAYPLPAIVITEMLGVPAADRDQFKKWSEDIVAFTGGGGLALAGVADRSQLSLIEASEYFRKALQERRCQPREDLISALVTVEEQGDSLNEEELLAMCVLLFVAGHETTMNLIGNGLLALLQNPGQMQKLRNDWSLIKSAVEEFLRFESPLQRQSRLASEDFEIAGRPIRRGQSVFAMAGAANRDPAQFKDPDVLDVSRKENRHVAFGAGLHFCIGAPLARLEAQIATNTLLHRFPSLRLSVSDLEWRENMTVRGLKSLPVVF